MLQYKKSKKKKYFKANLQKEFSHSETDGFSTLYDGYLKNGIQKNSMGILCPSSIEIYQICAVAHFVCLSVSQVFGGYKHVTLDSMPKMKV